MTLPTRNFDQIVSDQAAALQVAQPLFTFSDGSIVQALAEANAGMTLFLQYLIFKTAQSTRLASCFGADCDSFGADFLFARYPAFRSTGQVQFTRFTAPNQLLIPLTTIVKSSNNLVSFNVIADPNNAAYDAGLQAYRMNTGVQNLSVLVQCVTPGTIGNVAVGTVTKPGSSIAIGRITNLAPFVNGVDAESDNAYKNRFQLYINTRSAATKLAIENAIVNTQTGLTYTINENIAADFSTLRGQVTIWVDDGTGQPPDILFKGTANTPGLFQNIEAVRPAAVTVTVAPAHPIQASVQMSTAFNAGFNRNNYVGIIKFAVANYINSLAVGETLFLTRLYQVIYDSVPGALKDVYNLLINGIAADLIADPSQVVRFISAVPAGSNTPVSEVTVD